MSVVTRIQGAVLIAIVSVSAMAASVDPSNLSEPGVPAAKAPAPLIACDQPVYEFGERDESETVEHTFVLHNRGDAPLEIVKVKASCGCTAATLASNTVPPGATTEIQTSLKLKGRRGLQKKSIRVESNDPTTPIMTLWINGQSLVDLGFEPSFVNFGQLSRDNALREKTARLLSRDPAIEITEIVGTSANFELEVKADDLGKKREILVRLIPPFPKGFFRADFTVGTTHTTHAPLKLSASAVMPDPVIIMPREISLSGTHTNGVRRLMIVRAGTAEDLEVKGVEVPDARITSNVSKLRAGTYRIQLENLPVDPALNGKFVTIITDVEGYERLTVPIKVTTSAPAK